MSDQISPSAPVKVNTERAARDPRQAIDKDLPPTRGMSLTQWLSVWGRLAGRGQRQHERSIFGLTGHFTDYESGQPFRAAIEMTHYEPRADAVLNQVCDIDSVIGIALGQLPILDGAIIKYYMLPSFRHSLSTNLHIPSIRVRGEQPDSTKEVNIHQVPNTRFLVVEPCALVRIFFPGLEPNGASTCMSKHRMQAFYDLAVRPAAVQTLPEELHREWPSRFKDELYCASTSNRGNNAGPRGRTFQQSGRDVHASHLNPWVDCIRRIVEEHADIGWARGFFFGVEMRGLKNREDSFHPPPEGPLSNEQGEIDPENLRTKAIDRILQDFDTTKFEPGLWFLDIATTVTVSDDWALPAGCTYASTRKHANLLSLISDIELELCQQYVEGRGSYYQMDELAHLNDVSGFRFTVPRAHSENTGMYYIQVYTTDKGVTYNINKPHNSQRTTVDRLLKSWTSELKDHVEPLLGVFETSAETRGVALRIETRMEYEAYPTRQLRIHDESMRCCIYHMERQVIWGWKRCRLTSMRDVLSKWIENRASYTQESSCSSLSLLVILTWMMNALVNRPDSGGNWDRVHQAACVHDLEDGALVPIRPLGAIFLPAIRFYPGRQPRSSTQSTVPVRVLQYLLGQKNSPATETDLYSLAIGPPPLKRLRNDGRSLPDASSANFSSAHRGNKQRKVHIMSHEEPDDHFRYLVREPERLNYSSHEESDGEETLTTKSRSQQLVQLIHSYPVQIFAKAPKSRSMNGPWSVLTPLELAQVTFDRFSNQVGLQQAFECYQIIPATAARWDKMIETLFPTLSQYNDRKVQGVDTLVARDMFVQLLQSYPVGEQAVIVDSARKYATDHWLWLPFGSGKGHLWSTGTKGVPAGTVTHGTVEGGPWIVINPARATSVVW